MRDRCNSHVRYRTPDDVLCLHLAKLSLELLEFSSEVGRSPDVVGALTCRVIVAVTTPSHLEIQHGTQGIVGPDEHDQGLNPTIFAVCLRGLHWRQRLSAVGI